MLTKTVNLAGAWRTLLAAWPASRSEIRHHMGAHREGSPDHVPGSNQVETFRQLATLLLLTYALRNSDCHAKNLALIYAKRWTSVYRRPMT